MTGLSPTERHRLSTDLFLDALDQPPEAREAWLDAQAVDAELRNQARSLLAAHQSAENANSFELPALAPSTGSERGTGRPTGLGGAPADDVDPDHVEPPDPRTGTRVGPWRLLERIGTGGMGAVYKARRDDGAYQRVVALKVLRADADTRALARRLDAEGRVLARLEHPGIARFYDSGLSADGAPFLAMEYVDGTPITEAADHMGLDIRARAQLVIDVCKATSHAHRNLVVHRDIKPSNVFVTPDAQVRLLDFGIATLLDDEARAEATVLQTEPGALTPAYAAPEQIRREPVTLATDVYALGVLLYELLSGQRPYDLSNLTASQVERVLCEVVPPRPSAVAPPEHRRSLTGDLDTIILKALEKEPLRRYASAESLGDDLQRHLDGAPVSARAPTVSYRASSFVRRHRTGVAASALVVLALVGGLALALWQARVASAERDRAENRFALARETVQTLLFETHDSIADLPGSTPAREAIVASALAFLERLDAGRDDDPALRLDISRAYKRIGDVQGNPTDNNLGRTQDALVSYRRGLALLPTSNIPDSLVSAVRHQRAVLYEKLGDVVAHTVSADSGLAYHDRAMALFRQNADAEPTEPNALRALGIATLKHGDYTGNPGFPNAGRSQDAIRSYQRALRLFNQVLRLAPGDPVADRFVGLVQERLGTMYAEIDNLPAALRAYQASMLVRQRRLTDSPSDAVLSRDLGIAHEKLGLTYQQQGQIASARSSLTTALGFYIRLADADPQNVSALVTRAIGEMHLGALEWSADAPSARNRALSRAHYERAVEILRAASAADTANQRTESILAEAQQALASR